MKGPDRAPSSFKLPAATGLVLLRHSGLELVRPLHIRPDAITSFEDGKPYKALRRHLTMRGLTPEAYRQKWGLPVDYPLVAASYSARRSEISSDIASAMKGRSESAPGADAAGPVPADAEA